MKVDTEPCGPYPDHFFEAEVGDISRHAAGALLNEDAVRSYISEVCPVPLSRIFPFTHEVEGLFGSDRPLMTQAVTVNGGQSVHRQYGESIRFSDSRTDDFKKFEGFRIPGVTGAGDAAVVWVTHSSYLGAIPKATSVRGIRARMGNIQIGDESVFDHLFREDRFNRWCVGEVHILDPRIMPNGRRDYFEPSPHLRNLENHLGAIFRGLSTRCRTSSAGRNKGKKSVEGLFMLEDAYELAITGYLSENNSAELVKEALTRETKVREEMASANTLPAFRKRLDRVKAQLSKFKTPTSAEPYDKMPPYEVDAYQRVFQELVESAASISSAKRIIENILSGTRLEQS